MWRQLTFDTAKPRLAAKRKKPKFLNARCCPHMLGYAFCCKSAVLPVLLVLKLTKAATAQVHIQDVEKFKLVRNVHLTTHINTNN